LKLKPSDEKAATSPVNPPTAAVSSATTQSTSETSTHTTSPISTVDNASIPSTNSNLHGINGAKTTAGHFNNISHGNVPRKTTAPVEANGVWVKETLPALKASDK